MSESEVPWYADVVMPALIGAARRGYGRAMREALDAAGYDDVPRAGMRMIGGIARNGPAGPDVSSQLGVRAERAERVVSALVARGYVVAEAGEATEQSEDAESGPTYVLTDRGQAAAEVSGRAAQAFEDTVRARVGDRDFATTRAVLGAMVELSDRHF